MKRAFAIAMLVGIASVIAIVNLGYGGFFSRLVAQVPGRDLTAHFVLFGLLGFAVNRWRAAVARVPAAHAHARVTAVLAVVITLEELSQMALSTRSFSTNDLGASLAGLLVGAVASLSLSLREERSLGPGSEES